MLNKHEGGRDSFSMAKYGRDDGGVRDSNDKV